MNLTPEQIAIINSTGNIKINAVAGSGKTTTIIEYARTRPAHSNILYLAFNKSVKIEAVKKFVEKGLTNVKVETAHSLAYKHIVFKYNYKVKQQGYKTNEIADLLSLQSMGEKHTEYVVANHINKLIAYFCNSDKQKVQELNYLDLITDKKAKTFVKTYYTHIEKQARILLSKMDKGEIEITHDFYLKKFQLAAPQLLYDYILFDEGQDASAAMLDIFIKQPATKVIVGDTHQQIYGWRHAVNSLEKADFTTFHLSTSFRFAQPIANLAMDILKWKNHIGDYTAITIAGKGTAKTKTSKAILARTNLGLLLKAIEFVTETKKLNHIYFEGNINSYTYADEGASLYDVLNLYNGKHHLIKDSLIKAMTSMEELEEYIDKAEDAQLGMMVEIVEEYGNEIPGILKTIKDKHVGNEEKHKAEMIFSTVHRCKGMEYDTVELVDDFIKEEKLEDSFEKDKKAELDIAKLNEEINLLYVAITRTKNILTLPEALVPANFPASPHIQLIKIEKPAEQKATAGYTRPVKIIKKQKADKEKAYTVQAVRETYKGAYQPWTAEMDKKVKDMYISNKSITEMANHFGRTKGAVYARIKKMELEKLYK